MSDNVKNNYIPPMLDHTTMVNHNRHIEEASTNSIKSISEDNNLKLMVIDYVGHKMKPESDEVTLEDIFEVFSAEFPELLLALAEENFIRGYSQAMADVDNINMRSLEEEAQT